MHARLERELMALMRRHGLGPESTGSLSNVSGVLRQGLHLYRWSRIVGTEIVPRRMADGRTMWVANVLFKGGHSLGTPESMPLPDRESAERDLAGTLAAVRWDFPKAERTVPADPENVEFRLFDVRIALSKASVDLAREAALKAGGVEEAAESARVRLIAMTPMGMSRAAWDAMPEAARAEIAVLCSLMAAADRFLLTATDPLWRALHLDGGGEPS